MQGPSPILPLSPALPLLLRSLHIEPVQPPHQHLLRTLPKIRLPMRTVNLLRVYLSWRVLSLHDTIRLNWFDDLPHVIIPSALTPLPSIPLLVRPEQLQQLRLQLSPRQGVNLRKNPLSIHRSMLGLVACFRHPSSDQHRRLYGFVNVLLILFELSFESQVRTYSWSASPHIEYRLSESPMMFFNKVSYHQGGALSYYVFTREIPAAQCTSKLPLVSCLSTISWNCVKNLEMSCELISSRG